MENIIGQEGPLFYCDFNEGRWHKVFVFAHTWDYIYFYEWLRVINVVVMVIPFFFALSEV